MFRHVLVSAMIALVVLTGANVATACCFGWGCGWGCGSYCAPSYSHCAPSYCAPAYCPPTHCAPTYCAPYSCFGGHCYAPAAAPVHHAAAPVAPAFASADRGRLVVTLPADAALLVDGQRTTASSAQRTFVTPPIEAGRTYYYTLTAEVNRDGVNRSVTEKVYVRPGQTTQVSLTIADVGTGVAAR